MENLIRSCHYLIHLQTHLPIQSLLLVLTIINKAQEISITKNQSMNEMKSIVLITDYSFVVNSVSSNQFIIILIIFFIIHLLFTFSFIYFHFYKKVPQLFEIFMNMLTIFYTVIFYIPVTYSSFLFLSNNTICYDSSICSNSFQIGLVIICIINITFSSIMAWAVAYLGRCEKIMEDNNVLALDYSIIRRIIMNILILVIIILGAFEELQILRFGLIIVKNSYYIISTITQLSLQSYTIIELISLTINIGIYLDLPIYELFLLLTICISFMIGVQRNVSSYHILQTKQTNVQTIQILSQLQDIGDKQSQIILALMKRNHMRQCVKCRSLHQITECILRKMSNQKNQSYIILYCNFIATHMPLKSMIKILIQDSKELYYRCSFYNLSQELSKKASQIQSVVIHKNAIRNTGEHLVTLDVQSVFNTLNSPGLLFQSIIDTINSKITFWSKLINGYFDINHYLNETLRTSTKMLKCRNMIEDRFDLQNFRLKQSQFTDIVTMRILQIYYSGIYSNSFFAYQLEKSIEDILKNERFKQDESLDNIQLVSNRLIILKSSLVKKRGELINLNIKQLSMFLEESEENLKSIKHCDQLMPQFISSIHDQLMDNYLQRGFSKLMIHGESTYLQTLSGYIEECNINLFNFYNGEDDFILNMIITKQQTNNETLLFGIDGRILGVTQLFFNDVIKNTMKQTITSTTKGTDQSQLNLEIEEYISKHPLIQAYIPGILIQVSELRQQIQQTQNYQSNNLKSIWLSPTNHQNCFLGAQTLFYNFKKKTIATQNQQTHRSMSYSKYSFSSLNTQGIFAYDDSDFPEDIKNQISVDGIPLIILHPQVQQSVANLSEFKEENKQHQILLFYNLQFKTLIHKKSSFGYFVLTLKEYKEMNTINNPNTSQGSQFSGLTSQMQMLSQKPSKNQSEIIDESQDIMIQEVKMMNNMSMKLREGNESFNEISKLKQSDRSNLFDSSRLPLFAKPKHLEQDSDVEKIEQDMKAISELRQLRYLDDEQEGEVPKLESKSQSIKKNSNILEKFRTKQMETKDKAADFASNPSRTSTNSTSKESLLIVQQLYYNTALILPLRKISFLLFIICIGIFICNIVNVLLISENLNYQTNQLSTLRQPQNMNYFYCSIIIQEWYQYLQTMKLVNLSPFIIQRNMDTLQGMYDYARSAMIDLTIAVPKLAQQEQFNLTFQTKFVIQKEVQFIEYPLQNFYTMMYEFSESSYRNNLGQENVYYPELLTNGMIRLNLLKMIDFHNQLIIAITTSTISAQQEVKSYFLSIMMGELFSVIFIIAIQMRYWLYIDHIVKAILFLVSRLNENQAQDQINKLMIIKDQIENQSNWKLFNFGDVMYGFSEKKAKKVILKSNILVNQNNVRATSALFSRIQNTYYLNRNNAASIFILAFVWSIYLMSGFLLHMAKNDNFQPSLVVTLKFVQFRHNMDSLCLLAGLIKSEPIIPDYDLSYINQTLACQLLTQYKDNLSPLINEIADVILQNANANGEKSRFDSILNYDLCLSSTLDALPFCDMTSTTLTYFNDDSYLNLINNGALGFTAALVKFINQEFNYEIQNQHYSEEANFDAVNSQSFQNFVLQYFTDIQTTMRSFLNLFQADNTSIADGIISVIQTYYLGVGIWYFMIINQFMDHCYYTQRALGLQTIIKNTNAQVNFSPNSP